MEEKKEITIEDLAVMVQNGFVENRGYMDKKFEVIEKKIDNLEKGQESMSEKLDQKVNTWDHKSLVHRVETLELKAELNN
jgi:hypothetical protein